ncbi:unnamed protein product [Phytophthora fragariaefolia]|uniref:Unnamed protein product n=1 Tax=Phytophthora fragariaefolia TaxID=1490495 RepID=A0A9W7DAU4_9STRA|nr:unnamed protein product [Phytophthora fragariaefolia]
MLDTMDDAENDATDMGPNDYTLRLSDDEDIAAQNASKFVQKLSTWGEYNGMTVANKYELVTVETANCWRVVLPPTLWAALSKEMHGSVWSGHLRGPHTYGRVAQCEEAIVTMTDEAMSMAETSDDDVEVSNDVVQESGRPCARQDMLHSGDGTDGSWVRRASQYDLTLDLAP